MKNTAIAMLLVFGASVAGGALACDGSSGHDKADKAKSSTNAPAAPAPAPAK